MKTCGQLIVVGMEKDQCNIPNFGPNTYRNVPIDYDVELIFYFDILGRRPHCI